MGSQQLSALLIAFLATACSGRPASGPSDLLVISTTSIWGDVTANVVGSAARVEVLMPAGTDPHEFQPSARHTALLEEADLVIANGLGLEGNLVDLIEGADTEVLEVGPALDPLPIGDGHDPHVWLDPLRVAEAVELIVGRLPGVEGERGGSYREELLDTHQQLESLLADVPPERRLLVTNHHFLGYLADRYGLEVVGTIIRGTSTLAEPSPGELAELARVIRETKVPAIFVEAAEPTPLAEAVAEEAGDVEVVTLFIESLGPPGSGAETYLGLLLTNAQRIAEALR
jgi:zinc/manganese transport system substrate-binding protein